MKRYAPWLLLLVAALAYANSFRGSFVFDDITSIPKNSTLSRWPDVLTPPDRGETVTGRPVVNVSLAATPKPHGDAVFGYHLGNLLIHTAAGLLLFGLLRRVLRSATETTGRGTTGADGIALAISALWVAHPLQTESVTYIVQRAESLMGLFYFATLYAFVRSLETKDAGRGFLWLALSVLACGLGMGTKEVMVSAPLIVWLYDRTCAAGSFAGALRQRPWYYVGLAATWIVLVAEIWATGGNRGGSTVGLRLNAGWLEHALTQLPAMFTYLSLSVWPFPLAFDYETTWPSGLADVLPGFIAVAVLVSISVIALWRNDRRGILGAWFFAVLAPTSLVPAPTQFIAEHRMYVALAPVVVATVIGIVALIGRRAQWLGVAAVTAFVALTLHRNLAYRTETALWRDTVFRRPNDGLAHQFLGDSLRAEKRFAEALAEYDRAIEITPNFIGFNNVGSLLTLMGRPDEALPYLQAAVADQPHDGTFRYNLGLAFARVGRMREAVTQFEAALKYQPKYDDAENNLGNALLALRRPAEAAPHFYAAVRINPGNAEAQYNAGAICYELGRFEEAAKELQRAVALTPNDADAHALLGATWERLGELTRARDEYEAALRLNPTHAMARAGLDRVRVGPMR